MKSHSHLFVLAILFVLVSSCKKEGSEDPIELPSPSARVLVSCEGSFGSSNASLASYDPSSKESFMNAFDAVNGYGPGDVLQSIVEHIGQLYLVLNGSAKIEVVNETSLEAQSPINGLISPRSFLPISENKAYVSNLFSDNVQVIDISSKTVTGTIDIGGWSEGMVLIGDEVFVARNDGSAILVIDATQDLVIDSIEVGLGPKDIVQDINGNIWVLSLGYDTDFNVVDAKVSMIEPESRSLTGSYDIPQPWAYKMDLRINASKDGLLILNNNVYAMGIEENSIDQEPFIDNGLSNYGLGIDPNNDDIYVGFAPDFSSEGTVFRYSSSGVSIDEFQVGIAPNGFYFKD